METRTCKTCDAPVVGNYCPACGQRHLGERITLRYIGVELFQMLTNLERGLWHTLLELVRNPGQVIRNYLSGATVLYYQPVRFLLLLTGLSALMTNLVDFDKIMETTMNTMNVALTPEQKALQSTMMHKVLRYTNVIMALNVPITSIGTFVAYRKFRNTYAEHLVANAYLYGLLSSISVFTIWFTSMPGLFVPTTIFANFATLFFNIWFFKSWHQTSWLNAIWRSILGFALSLLIIVVLANVVTLVLMKAGVLPTAG